MTGENSHHPDEARIQAMVRALPTPAARPAFRADLKGRFVAGTLGGPVRETSRRILPWYRQFSGLMMATAAAAVIAAVVLLSAFNRGPSWQLANPLAAGQVVVNGETLALLETENVDRYLRPGAEVSRPDSTGLDLIAGQQLWIEIAPGGAVELPPAAGRWWGRTLRARVTGGEVRFTTGPEFAGGVLHVDTQLAAVEVLGSTIAVIDSPDATCVCVFAGSVRVGRQGGELEPVSPGMRKVIYRDDVAPLIENMQPMERMKLQMLQDRAFPGSHRE